ncbi:MAG: methylated-DNA--[protein]-cysteine S-methyltransferase [Planctomycetota bacterium]
MNLSYSHLDTPVGRLLLVADRTALKELRFPGKHSTIDPDWIRGSPLLQRAEAQLLAYFNGKRQTFDLPLAPEGTEFQRQVWEALRQIPYGSTVAYSEIAQAINRPRAVRAVGAANGKNPLPIVIPCHRVIGKSGSLTGFGGGLKTKQQLLDLEQSQK